MKECHEEILSNCHLLADPEIFALGLCLSCRVLDGAPAVLVTAAMLIPADKSFTSMINTENCYSHTRHG